METGPLTERMASENYTWKFNLWRRFKKESKVARNVKVTISGCKTRAWVGQNEQPTWIDGRTKQKHDAENQTKKWPETNKRSLQKAKHIKDKHRFQKIRNESLNSKIMSVQSRTKIMEIVSTVIGHYTHVVCRTQKWKQLMMRHI